MATDDLVRRWLDLLIQQTNYGNVTWHELRTGEGYSFSASDSVVFIETRDGDGLLPYRITVTDGSGVVTNEWMIYGEGVTDDDMEDAAPEWLADRGRMLWEEIRAQFLKDPVASMVNELEQMPPF